MEAFSSPISCTPLLSHSASSTSFSRPKSGLLPSRRTQSVACYGSRGDNFGGRQVDEDMIGLRKRIHDMKMVERNYEPPSGWMEWERRWYTSYNKNVHRFVGALQSLLMNTRPSVALGVAALLTLSVPTSAVVVVCHLMDAVNGIFSGVHLG